MTDLTTAAHGPNRPDGTSDPEWAAQLAALLVYEARTMDLERAVELIRARIELVRLEGIRHGLNEAQRTVVKAFEEHDSVSRETPAAAQ